MILYQYKKGRKVEYETGDVIIPRTWHYLTDSSFLYGNVPCKIEKLTSDTFLYWHRGKQIILSNGKE